MSGKYIKSIFVLILLVLTWKQLDAQLIPNLGGQRAGTAAAQFLKIGVGGRATAMGEVMVLATYRIDLVQVTGDILFAFPLSALEELREQLKSPFPIVERDSAWVRSRMDAHLLDIEVSVQAVVDQVAISLEEVLRLHPGDILQIDPQCMDRVELWVEGKPRFCVRAAQTNGVKVFAVSGRMKKTGSNAESGGYTDD